MQWLSASVGLLAVPGGLLLGARLARIGHRDADAWSLPSWMPGLAGCLLLAVVLGDLVPDAVSEGAGLGSPLLLIVLPGVVTLALAGALLWRRAAAAGCCTPATGLVTALALAGHGLAEGLVVGLGVGAGPGAALAAIGLVSGHRVAEGFALGAALRGRARRDARLLIALAALAPVAGGALGLVATPGARLGVVITACLAGLLVAAAVRLLAASAAALLASPGQQAAMPS